MGAQVPLNPTCMRLFKDPILLALAGILATLLLLFFVGVIPYPFGLLVLLVVITARVLYKS